MNGSVSQNKGTHMNPSSGSPAAQLPQDVAERRKAFHNALANGEERILFDGGVSSLLYERGVFINRSFDEVVLSQPELVKEIHSDYLEAGSMVLTTNTFSANAHKLAAFGLSERLLELNQRAAEIARMVAGSQAWVAGCMGPLGVRLEPWGPTSFEEARHAFKEQASALISGGVDIVVLESFGDLNEIQQAILGIRDCHDQIPIVAMMTTNEDGESLYGTPTDWFIKKLDLWGADLIGINGGAGPSPLLDLVDRMKAATQKPLILKPKAGAPRIVDGRVLYMASPEYMGEFARNALLKGVRAIGGCSGINPPHIRAMAGAIRQNRAFQSAHVKRSTIDISDSIVERTPTEAKSAWAKSIRAGEFVVCLELLPPKGLDCSKMVERASYCKKQGVHAINIPDGPRASARMSAVASACILEKEVGIETIVHYACRDRNLLGIQSDLIGASALGIRNVLCVTGDPPKLGPYPNATPVFDIDAIGLVNMCARLNSGRDLGDADLGGHTEFSIGVGANPVAPDMDLELKRFRYKIEAGAEWAITQPIFDEECLFRFLDAIESHRVPVIAGVWPFSSLRNALFMANEVPGVIVPQKHIDRIGRFTTAEDQASAGMEIARELVSRIRSRVQGLQISAPLGRVEFALQLIDH
jgi:methionine synthase I (cobalamin-dependent)/5,10-methylenetetrahydrofolate reductase